MSAVTIRDVRKRYAIEVIHGVSADIEDGEFVTLVVPSGWGKSTLLRMIAGLELISSGTVSIGGRVVNDDNVTAGSRAGSADLWPHLGP